MKHLLLFFSLFFLLSGCSIPTNIYVQNHTNEVKYFKIQYVRTLDLLRNNGWHVKPEQISKLLQPKKFESNENLSVPKWTSENDIDLTIELPPKSTTRILRATNHHFDMFIESVEFDDKRYTTDELWNIAKRKKGHLIIKVK